MSNFLSSYERLAKMYSKKSGVQVHVAGDSFMTDGKKIIIADVPPELNKSLKDPALAGLVHECLHVEHSKFLTQEEAEVDEFGTLDHVERGEVGEQAQRQGPGRGRSPAEARAGDLRGIRVRRGHPPRWTRAVSPHHDDRRHHRAGTHSPGGWREPRR